MGTFGAIIPAAGLGTRLAASDERGQEASAPKALRLLAGRSLLQRAVDALSPYVAHIVVAAPPALVDGIELRSTRARVTVVAGGDTRQQSVRCGLAALGDEVSHVLVHDAARALVPREVVARVIDALHAGATCVVPVVPVADSLRAVRPGGSNGPVDRSAVRLVQTPQGFDVAALRRGHAAALTDLATDDATLVESTGEPVTLVEGDPLAFKITRPVDLMLAEAIVAQQAVTAQQ